MPYNQSVNHDANMRLQASALAEHDIKVKIIKIITQLSNQTVYRLKKQARDKNYDSEINMRQIFLSIEVETEDENKEMEIPQEH